MNSANLITISPIPENFNSNINNITQFSGDNSFKNGAYVASSSSYSDENSLAFNAFNQNSTSCWISSNIGSNGTPKYITGPYNGVVPSTYIGGGSQKTTFKTIVDGKNIFGEWLQLEIPYKICLLNYSILCCLSKTKNSSVFIPRIFYLVGSNDGIKWDFIDHRYLTVAPTNLSEALNYNINTPVMYRYFRLIIKQLFTGSYAQICQFNMKGYRRIITNSAEPFVTEKNISKNSIPTHLAEIMNNSLNFKPFNTINNSYSKFTPEDDHNEQAEEHHDDEEEHHNDEEEAEETIENFNASDYNGMVNGIDTNYDNLDENITSYENLKDKLNSDTKYDYSGNSFNYNNKNKTLVDGLNDDVNLMLTKENNIFILGSLTVAILVIGTIVLNK